MNLTEALHVLRFALSHFVDLKPAIWEDVCSRWTLKSFNKNEIILAEGQTQKHLHFILTGVQRLYCIDKNGDEQTLAFGYNNEFFGNMYSFFSHQSSDYFIEALSPGSMLALPAADYYSLFDEYPVFDRLGRLFLENVLLGRGKREREMLTMTAQERFVRLHKESPHLFQLVPHKHLASYIGMRPETFSRMWKSL